MARALFRDEVVLEAFPDGLVWITVGREPSFDWSEKLREIATVLGAAIDGLLPDTLYKSTIANKAALIVIDDVWNRSHLDPFLAESPRSRFLFTTRDASIGRFCGAREYRADLLDYAQSRELLALWAGTDIAQLPPAADDILHECGRLPLALSTIGALLRGGEPSDWTDTARLLHNADLAEIEEQLPPGQQSFFRAIDVSVKALDGNLRDQYGRLGVLLDDMPASLPVLETIWKVGAGEARRIGRRLADRSLAQWDAGDGLRLHDLQLDYFRAQFPDRNGLNLIHGAVQLSAHVLENPSQFASQVPGRLLPYRNVASIKHFIDGIAAGSPVSWLRPIHQALHPPGTTLIRTLEGHSDGVLSVAIAPDGRRAVSASEDRTLLVWDLVTGRVLHLLKGHSAGVNDLAVTPDGRSVVSVSTDRTLKVWDLATGIIICTMEGHSDSVNGVALSPDGQWAVSASSNHTLKVWELKTGQAVRTLEGHTRQVNGVAVTPDGKRVISACGFHAPWIGTGSPDDTLKVWDLTSGRALMTLEGHSDGVRRVRMSPDGRSVVSASSDGTLRLWGLDRPTALRTVEAHSAAWDAAIMADGRRVIAACSDGTLRILDLETGRELRTLEGHSGGVYAVAFMADGQHVISASGDKTLKLWELVTGRVLLTLVGHSASVTGVAVAPDGLRVISTSLDKTLRVWDLSSGIPIACFHCDGAAECCAFADDNHIVAGDSGGSLYILELITRSITSLPSP